MPGITANLSLLAKFPPASRRGRISGARVEIGMTTTVLSTSLCAVPGDPPADLSPMTKASFVMKAG